MNTTEFLEREIRRAEISLRHAQRKPHTPKEELRGLRDKIACLEEALTAVQRRCLAEKPMTMTPLFGTPDLTWMTGTLGLCLIQSGARTAGMKGSLHSTNTLSLATWEITALGTNTRSTKGDTIT